MTEGKASHLPSRRSIALTTIKAVHSLIFALQTMIGYLVYKGIRGESDRKAITAAAIGGA